MLKNYEQYIDGSIERLSIVSCGTSQQLSASKQLPLLESHGVHQQPRIYVPSFSLLYILQPQRKVQGSGFRVQLAKRLLMPLHAFVVCTYTVC